MLNLPNAITLTRIALVVVFTAAVSVADQYSWGKRERAFCSRASATM